MILPILAELGGSIHVGLAAMGVGIGIGLTGLGMTSAVGRNPGAFTQVLVHGGDEECHRQRQPIHQGPDARV